MKITLGLTVAAVCGWLVAFVEHSTVADLQSDLEDASKACAYVWAIETHNKNTDTDFNAMLQGAHESCKRWNAYPNASPT
jgi:hypothetical protein